jgi:hypothetical protein
MGKAAKDITFRGKGVRTFSYVLNVQGQCTPILILKVILREVRALLSEKVKF